MHQPLREHSRPAHQSITLQDMTNCPEALLKPFYHFISLILVFIAFALNLLAAAQSASCFLLGNGVCETLPSQQGRGCHLPLQ